MERDLRKRENRAKQRGHNHRGGRGGGRGGAHIKSQKPKLESNEWRFEEVTEDTENMLLRKATIEACSRVNPTVERDIRSCIPDDQAKLMSEILSKLSLEEQTTQEFIVPVPKLSAALKVSEQAKIETKPAVAAPAPKPASKAQDLDAWLDGLLG